MSKTMIFCPVSRFVESYICLGSNCDESQAMLAMALEEISCLHAVRLAGRSSLYFTEPQDFAEQPWFCNQVVRILVERSGKSQWNAHKLLATLLKIEKRLGRVRDPAIRFGPRKIDLDLLLFGQAIMNDPECTLPHPRMLKRAFVLVPLTELAPGLTLENRTASQWLGNLDYNLEGKKIFQKPD